MPGAFLTGHRSGEVSYGALSTLMPELPRRRVLSLFEDIPFYAHAARLKAKVSPTAAISAV